MSKIDVLRNLIRESIQSSQYTTTSGSVVEYGSQGHVEDIENIIKELQRVKHSLRRGPDRHRNRKEMHRLQSAVEALRFLKKRAEKSGIKNGLLKGTK